MALQLYANPYDTSVKGFYFKDFDDYEKKAEKSRAEEFEIEFIDGDDEEQMLFKAMGVHQGNIEEYFDLVDDLDEEEILKLKILMEDIGYDFDDAMDKKDDLIVYGEFKDDEDFAMEYVDGIGSIEDALGKNAENYFDFDSFGRDLRISGDLYDEDDPDSEERYEGMSDQEIGEEFIDDMGGVGELDKDTQERYFDWSTFSRDLMMDMGESDGVYYDPSSV
jgi:antirestriction protein